MLDWFNNLGNQFSGVLTILGLAVTFSASIWKLWISRKKLWEMLESGVYYFQRFIGAEYREAYRRRRITHLTAEIENLDTFGRGDEMECLSKIFSYLSFAAMAGFYFLVCVWLNLVDLEIAVSVILEREILKLPARPITPEAKYSGHRQALVAGVLLLVFIFLLSEVASQAAKLSRR